MSPNQLIEQAKIAQKRASSGVIVTRGMMQFSSSASEIERR